MYNQSNVITYLKCRTKLIVLFYEVVLMYLEKETKIVNHKDGENIDEHP
jgi:hypothetical protein